MQINKLEVSVGATVNLGDYQSVNAKITIGADLDPREDDGQAFAELRKKAMDRVTALLFDNHPKKHRLVLDGGEPAQLAASPNGAEITEEKAKRTRRTKEQIAADEAAKAKAEAAPTQMVAQPDSATDETSEGDMASLLGDSIPERPPVSAADAKAAASQVIKKLGGPSLVKLLGRFHAKDFPTLDAEHYGNFVAKAKEMVGTA